MARPLRIEFPGEVYQVTSRGDRRDPIFVHDVDRQALLEVCRCVELNPVRAGLAPPPENWPWSSYVALTGQAPCPPWLDRASMWGYLLGENTRKGALVKDFAHRADRAYADLVAAGKDVALWPDHLRQQMYLGNEAFVLHMQALASDRAVSNKEIPKAPRASPKTLHGWLAGPDALPQRGDRGCVPAYAVELVRHCAGAGFVGLTRDPNVGPGAGSCESCGQLLIEPMKDMIKPIMGIYTARSPSSTADALFPKVRQRVLAVLFGSPDRSFYTNEVIGLAQSGAGAVQRELAGLAEAGLLTVRMQGNQKHFQANAASPVFTELRGLVLKTMGLAGAQR